MVQKSLRENGLSLMGDCEKQVSRAEAFEISTLRVRLKSPSDYKEFGAEL